MNRSKADGVIATDWEESASPSGHQMRGRDSCPDRGGRRDSGAPEHKDSAARQDRGREARPGPELANQPFHNQGTNGDSMSRATSLWVIDHFLFFSCLSTSFACATPGLRPGEFQKAVVEFQGQKVSEPVALMVNNNTISENDSFLVHQIINKAPQVFSDVIVVGDEKQAGGRTVITVDAFSGGAAGGLGSGLGLFGATRTIGVQGTIKRPSAEPIGVSVTHDEKDDLPLWTPAARLAAWGLGTNGVIALSAVCGVTLGGFSTLFTEVPAYVAALVLGVSVAILLFVVLPSFGTSLILEPAVTSAVQAGQQRALDRVASGAVVKFLNAASKEVGASTPPTAQTRVTVGVGAPTIPPPPPAASAPAPPAPPPPPQAKKGK